MRQDNAEEGEGEEGGRERPLPMETRLAGGELRCRLRDESVMGPGSTKLDGWKMKSPRTSTRTGLVERKTRGSRTAGGQAPPVPLPRVSKVTTPIARDE